MTTASALRRVLGASVLGPVHRRDGLPNQDAMGWWGPSPGGHVVAAVADGHGSRKAFRSRMGAQLAVDAGINVGRTMAAHGLEPVPDFAAVAAEMVARWQAAVRRHLDTMPLREDELHGLAEADGPAAREAVETEPVLAYGATLLVSVVVESSAVFLQLGDGDILAVAPSGRTTRPMAEDPRLLGNETTSLCMRGAERQFRCASRSLTAGDVALLMMASDGLGNAYTDEAALMQVGGDLLQRMVAEGPDAVAGELEAYLREASEHSGDDTTLVVVWLGSTGDPLLGSSLLWREPITLPPADP